MKKLAKMEPAPDMALLPPAERDAFSARRESSTRLLDQATALLVRSKETLDVANVFVLEVKKKYREIHVAYKSIVDPLEESKKNTKLLFDPVLTALAEAERLGKEKVSTYLVAEKNRVEREQREARERADQVQRDIEAQKKREADAAAKRAADVAIAEAKAAGLTKAEVKEYAALEAEGARAKVLEAPAPIVHAKPVESVQTSFSTGAGRMNAQFEYDYEVGDLDALNLARPDLVEKTPRRRLILDTLKATNGAPIPGLRVLDKAKMTGTI